MKQQVKISKIKPNKDNPRLIKGDKFKKLVKSIKEFPEMLKLRPNVVDKDRSNVGGNMRLKASKEAGLKEVWIEIAEGLTEDQKKEFIVKDNVGFGEWEWDMLANEWDSVQLAEWGLDVWENEDDKVTEGLIEDDEIPEVKESKVKRGDIWQLGEHRVMCGDSTSSDDVAKLMNGEKADMVFTDPPYGVDYSGRGKNTSNKIKNDNLGIQETANMIFSALTSAYIYSNEGATIFVWHADSKEGLRPLFEKAFIDSGWGLRATIIWSKKQASMGFADYRSQHEPCLYGWKGAKKERVTDRTQTTIWEEGRDSKYVHPTQKPTALAERAFKNHKKTVNVLDLFLGSGSTLIAAEKLNRKCYGMELDEKYCDVIINRWEQFTGLKAIKNGTK